MPLFVNLYAKGFGRTEANVHVSNPTGKHADNLLLLHGNWFQNEMDQNSTASWTCHATRGIMSWTDGIHRKATTRPSSVFGT